MTERTPAEIEAWEQDQRRRAYGIPEPKKLLIDRLFDTVKRVSPEMPEATAWKLVAALIAAFAADQGVDLT